MEEASTATVTGDAGVQRTGTLPSTRSVASGKGPNGTDAPPGPVASATMSGSAGSTGAVVSSTDIVNAVSYTHLTLPTIYSV